MGRDHVPISASHSWPHTPTALLAQDVQPFCLFSKANWRNKRLDKYQTSMRKREGNQDHLTWWQLATDQFSSVKLHSEVTGRWFFGHTCHADHHLEGGREMPYLHLVRGHVGFHYQEIIYLLGSFEHLSSNQFPLISSVFLAR